MAIYSHSKINTFETCPYQYKLHYIDKIKPDMPQTIEAFMGDLVHQTLELMYKNRKFKKRVEKKVLIAFYRDLWEKEYSNDILIAKEDEGLKADNYKKMGEKFIVDYYESHKDDDMTILGLETQDKLTLPDGNSWHVRIDKLGCKGETYFVCDYKTNARIKMQEEADGDRQLAMYSIWVKDKFKDAKKVILKWHLLAFNKEITSERTDEQLKELQQEVMDTIKEIEESTKENYFPTNPTKLCDYCLYKSECPSFKHKLELEAKEEVKKFKNDDGVKLVDEFSEVKTKLKELKDQEEELQEKLIAFAKQKSIDVVYGSNMQASVKEFEKIEIEEENKNKLIELLKKKGLYETYSMLCSARFNSHIIKGELKDEDIRKLVDFVKDFRISLSKRKDLEEE